MIETHGDLLSGRSWGWQAFLFAVSPLFGNDMDGHPLQLAWVRVGAVATRLGLHERTARAGRGSAAE